MLPKTRIAKPREVLAVRPLVKADLAKLREPRRALPQIQKIRESHHHLARLYAAGLRHRQVAERTGYTIARCQQIYAAPAFKDLIASLVDKVDEAWLAALDDYYTLATGNMVRAELQISDRLAEAEDDPDAKIAMRDLISVSRDAADRFGYGKKQTNLNVNVDFAARLDKAIARSGKVIEGALAPVLPEGGLRASPSPMAGSTASDGDGFSPPSEAVAVTPIRRRA